MYFLGFAGFGDERVFAEEIELAAQRVAARYGTGERSLRLVNDRRDLEKYPLATVASLRYALDALGARHGRGRCAVPRVVVAWLGGRHDRHFESRACVRRR